MQTRTTRKSELPARERILRTAHDLFYGEGIRATGIDRIIAEAGVTKVTFYRHFPSKNDLVLAYLDYRHAMWIGWFIDALQRYRRPRRPSIEALLPAMEEWFNTREFRGCAFINGVVEFDGAFPGLTEISRRHKEEMTRIISGLLPASPHAELEAQAMATAVDGAIIRCQMDGSPDNALKALGLIMRSLGARQK